MVEFTSSRYHDGALGSYTLIEVDAGDVLQHQAWYGIPKPSGTARFILPDILVGEEQIAELEEEDPSFPTGKSLLVPSVCLSRIYQAACDAHDARVALMTKNLELPFEPWQDELRILKACRFDTAHNGYLLQSGDLTYTIKHKLSTPDEIAKAIRNGLRSLTGMQKANHKKKPYSGSSASLTALYVLQNLRPYAAKQYQEWIALNEKPEYCPDPLFLTHADLAFPAMSARLTYRNKRVSCTISLPGIEITEETVTFQKPIFGLNKEDIKSGSDLQTILPSMPSALTQGRTIKSVSIQGVTDTFITASLDVRSDQPAPRHVIAVPYSKAQAEQLVENLLGKFTSATKIACTYARMIEPHECLSRLTKVHERTNSETLCVDIPATTPRFVLRGETLDVCANLTPTVRWNRRGLRISNLPIATMHALAANAKGKALREIVDAEILEGLQVTRAMIVPKGRLRTEELLLHAA